MKPAWSEGLSVQTFTHLIMMLNSRLWLLYRYHFKDRI